MDEEILVSFGAYLKRTTPPLVFKEVLSKKGRVPVQILWFVKLDIVHLGDHRVLRRIFAAAMYLELNDLADVFLRDVMVIVPQAAFVFVLPYLFIEHVVTECRWIWQRCDVEETEELWP